MLPILNLGPLAIQTPGLILILGLWIGLTQAEKYARRLKINPDHIYTLTFLSLAVGILGARLTYVAQNPAAFQNNWIGVFSLTPKCLIGQVVHFWLY
jgi:phosphatidylglycerol---prolipoprotein diacylglyceryl transferase